MLFDIFTAGRSSFHRFTDVRRSEEYGRSSVRATSWILYMHELIVLPSKYQKWGFFYSILCVLSPEYFKVMYVISGRLFIKRVISGLNYGRRS